MRIKICGIYLIRNPKGRVYIGQSTDVYERWKHYKRGHCKHQVSLLASFIKYGIEKHVFELLCQCERAELNNWEKYYVELFQSSDRRYGMNLKEGGGVKASCSKETREKLSKGNARYWKGKKLPREHVEKMRQTKLAQHVKVSEEMKKRISEKMKGRKQTEEHKENSRKAMAAVWERRRGTKRGSMSEEQKAKIGKANKGKPSSRKGTHLSEETKVKLREKRTGMRYPDEWKRNISKGKKGIPWSKARRDSYNKRRFKYERVLLPCDTRAA